MYLNMILVRPAVKCFCNIHPLQFVFCFKKKKLVKNDKQQTKMLQDAIPPSFRAKTKEEERSNKNLECQFKFSKKKKTRNFLVVNWEVLLDFEKVANLIDLCPFI